MTVYSEIFLPKIPYIHRMYMVWPTLRTTYPCRWTIMQKRKKATLYSQKLSEYREKMEQYKKHFAARYIQASHTLHPGKAHVTSRQVTRYI